MLKEVVHSLAALKEYLKKQIQTNIFVIGGATIYQQLLPMATKLTRTVINKQIVGDTKMPTIDYDRWHLVNHNNYEKKMTS